MMQFITVTVVNNGVVVTVDRSLIVAASKDGEGMHAFHSVEKAVAFIRTELVAFRDWPKRKNPLSQVECRP